MMIDKNGVMYLPYGSQILRVTPDGIIHTVAGNSRATAIGDGGPALDARPQRHIRGRRRSTRRGTW